MTVRKKLILFSISVLALPLAIILILIRTIYYQNQWLEMLDAYYQPQENLSAMHFVIQHYEVFLVIMAVVCLIAIFISSLSFLHGIIKPLKELEKASVEFEKGNLDEPLTYTNQDEFSMVFAQFERMRVRFKDLLWQQVRDEQSRADLIANISHDLKTPITSISGYAQGVLDNVAKTPEQKQKYLKTIIAKAEELKQMADTLYTLSQLENTQLQFRLEPVFALEFIRNYAAEITISNKAVVLTTQFNIQPQTKIALDLVQIDRVVSNIVQNSIKYRRGDVVHMQISAYENEQSVIFCFADDGLGVPEESIDKLFDRFYRSDAARQNTQNGSGLGLSIAKEIVEAHNGHIWSRKNEKSGLKILISFPKQEY